MDKLASAEEALSVIEDGMTVGIGGWGPRRKPMALVRALLRSDVRDLTIVAYGGADVGLLCAAGKVRRVIFAFVSLPSASVPTFPFVFGAVSTAVFPSFFSVVHSCPPLSCRCFILPYCRCPLSSH